MTNEIIIKRIQELKETIRRIKNLPKVRQCTTFDGEDQRLWFESISKIKEFNNYIEEIDSLLSQYGITRLTDEEREEEFLIKVISIKRLPKEKELYFIDNLDMRSWYNKYIYQNKDYKKTIYNNLPEYQELDLSIYWTKEIKEEFIQILKRIRRIPKHREIKLSNGIDFTILLDKLYTYDSIFYEKVLLTIANISPDPLSEDIKEKLFINKVKQLEYIPYIQEERFPDGTDMFTWYYKIGKVNNPNLETIISKYIKPITKPNNNNIMEYLNNKSGRNR